MRTDSQSECATECVLMVWSPAYGFMQECQEKIASPSIATTKRCDLITSSCKCAECFCICAREGCLIGRCAIPHRGPEAKIG